VKRVQVAVVGGGDAAVAAAWAAATYGAETVNFDEAPKRGVQISSFTAKKFDEQSNESPIDVRLNSVVWGIFEERVLGVAGGSNSYQLQADQVILATGSTDLSCAFRGGSLPGVLTTRAIRSMLLDWSILPGRRFVVVGEGEDARQVDAEIEAKGGEIVARVKADEVDTLIARGTQGVESVELGGQRIQTDVVVVAVGRQPDVELALMAGCAVGYSEALGGFVPIRDDYLRTSRPGILVAGNAAGVCNHHVAMYEGHFAGTSAAHALGLIDDARLEQERRRYLDAIGDRVALAQQLVPSYTQV
jgi:sarcosine oxidase subunit alpha